MKRLFLALLFFVFPLYSLEEPKERLDSAFEEELSNQIVATDVPPLPRLPEKIELKPAEFKHTYKNPLLATSLATLFPGLGHLYLGDYQTAGELAGTTTLGIGSALYLSQNRMNYDLYNTILETSIFNWMYNSYAAYRDTRIHNGLSTLRYRMPTDTYFDLLKAPFSWSVMKKPTVWGGLIATFSAASLVSHLANFPEIEQQLRKATSPPKQNPLIAFPVGIGEESLFRGLIQSALLEYLPPWGAISISSLLFGVAHIPNALDQPPSYQQKYYTFVIPFITLSGIYDGWLTYRSHSLKESTALHIWYDFTLFALGALSSQSVRGSSLKFATSFYF